MTATPEAPCGTERGQGPRLASAAPPCVPHITHRAAKPLIPGEEGLDEAGIGSASAGLRPPAVPPPQPHPCQRSLEEASGLLGPGPDGPLILMGAICGAGTSALLSGVPPSILDPGSFLETPRAAQHGFLGETEPLFTPAGHKPPNFCSNASFLPALKET